MELSLPVRGLVGLRFRHVQQLALMGREHQEQSVVHVLTLG
jgi:hypothetical protein